MRSTNTAKRSLIVALVLLGAVGLFVRPELSIAGVESPLPEDQELNARLLTLQHAIDLYIHEHRGLAPELGSINQQLVGLTCSEGSLRAGDDRFGPYLMQIPIGIDGGTSIAAPGSPSVSWWYDESTAVISIPR